jgi:hypothetical protein
VPTDEEGPQVWSRRAHVREQFVARHRGQLDIEYGQCHAVGDDMEQLESLTAITGLERLESG